MTRHMTYEESFHIIEQAHDANLTLLDTVISTLETFTKSASLLLTQLSKIPNEIPKYKEKPKMMDIIKKKQKQGIVFDNPEPLFQSLWSQVCDYFCLYDSGLPEFINSLRSLFLTSLISLREEYTTEISALFSLVSEKNKELEETEKKYTQMHIEYSQAANNVNELQIQIAQNTDKSQSEANQKLLVTLGEAKKVYYELQNAVVAEHEHLNEIQYQYSLTNERALLTFEEVELKFNADVQNLFHEFANKVLEYSKQCVAEREGLSKDTNELDIAGDLQHLFEIQPTTRDWGTLEEENPSLPFNIQDYIEPKQIFNPELSFFGAVITTDFKPEGSFKTIKAGTKVTVLDTTDETRWKVSPEGHRAVFADPSIIERCPELERKLFKVKNDIEANLPDYLAAKAGEIVMAYRIDKNVAYCANSFYLKGQIQMENLEDYE